VTGAAVAALLAHRFRNLGVTVFGGTLAYWIATLVS
jgi:hypothetical protein